MVRFGAQQYGTGDCGHLQTIACDGLDICCERVIAALGTSAQRCGSCRTLSGCYVGDAAGACCRFGRGDGGRALGNGLALACPARGVVVGGVLVLFRRLDSRFFAYYLMHDYAFSAQVNGAYPAALEARLAVFKQAVVEGLQRDVDEVLVVGHSSGAYLAVSVLADVLRMVQLAPNGPMLNFLSLGQVVPMVSFLPNAMRLRGDLQYLAGCDQMAWVDVSALGDVCAFALCDPVAVSGVAPVSQYWPVVFSAAFSQTLSPARWRRIRWRFLRVHFQYLCAFDCPNDYDYFQITAGPLTLRQRLGSRASSPSCITEAVSKYTAVLP